MDWPALAAGAILAAAAVGGYGRTFSVPLLFDDVPSIADNPTIRHLGTALWAPISTTAGGRPVLNLSLALDYAISGTAVWSYHATNLAIHVLAGLTLFGILRRALSRSASQTATLAAFSCALLWVLHPLQTESVTYIIQRAESLMGLFYLLTLYCFIRGAEAKGPWRSCWHALSVLSCVLGMATKESMVSAPLIVLLYDRTCLAGSFREAWRRSWPAYAGLAATWLVLAFLILSTHGRNGSVGFGSGVPWWSYALSQTVAIVHYLRLSFWPSPLVFDYGRALTPLSFGVIPYALLVAGLVAATVWALIKKPVFGFAGAFFFAALAPSSSVVPVATETMAEHRMYLALIPIIALVVVTFYRWLGRAALTACLIVAACLAGTTWLRNGVYQSAESMWSDVAAKRPENDRAHNNLGSALDKMPGRLNEAIAQYQEALRLNPNHVEAHYNLGRALASLDRTPEAIAQYEDALSLDPNYVDAHYNLALTLEREPSRMDEAIAQYEETLRLKPDFADAHFALASDLQAMPGRLNDAIVQYREGLQLRPDYAEAHYNLGCALQADPSRLGEAAAQFEEALRLKPDFPDAHFNLGCILQMNPQRLDEAIAQFKEALRLKPDDATIHINLAITLLKIPGRTEEAVAHLREAMRIQPGNDVARQVLSEIGSFR